MDAKQARAHGDDFDDWPILRGFVAAEHAELSPDANLTSVFDLAHTPLILREPIPQGTRCPHYRIERGDGVTRFRQVEERDTEAYLKREENRRARQVVPRPPASVRTRSAKLLALLTAS